MLDVLFTLVRSLLTALRGNRDPALENVAPGHQLMVIQRRCPDQHRAQTIQGDADNGLPPQTSRVALRRHRYYATAGVRHRTRATFITRRLQDFNFMFRLSAQFGGKWRAWSRFDYGWRAEAVGPGDSSFVPYAPGKHKSTLSAPVRSSS